MVKRILSALIILFVSWPSVATKIEGKSKEYAGKKLEFFRFSDPVTQKKIHVFTIEPNREGNFSTDIKVDQTTFVFSDFGIYRGRLFLEKDKTVHLLLPPVREKSFADSKNPYFKPVEFWFATQEGNRLNDHVADFDVRLNQLSDRFFNQLYFSRSKSAFDSVSHLLAQQYEDFNSPTYEWHKKLKLKALEADAFRLAPEKFRKNYWQPATNFGIIRLLSNCSKKPLPTNLALKVVQTPEQKSGKPFLPGIFHFSEIC
jgi:hypothetical protein